jgi:hypothetical protein
LFELTRAGVEGFKFLVQRFELFLKILVAHGFASGHANVTTGIERPALRFDFFERGGTAQAGHVGEFRFLAENFFELRAGSVAAESEIQIFTAIEADEVGNKSGLRRRPFPMRPIYLPVDVAGINKQTVPARAICLFLYPKTRSVTGNVTV